MASTPDPPGRGGRVAGPERAGEYQIGAPIREGWGGTIHAGAYEPSGRPVTVEEIRPELVATPGLIDRLGDLGRAAAGLSDPHLLAVYDLVEDGQTYRLVAEWSDAPTLAALGPGSLPAELAAGVIDDVLAGLAALHEGGLFHGHVTAETVVVDAQGRARLGELAICAAAAGPSGGPTPDVAAAARLGLELLRNAGDRLDPLRRALETAAGNPPDARRLRQELAASSAAAVLGSRQHAELPPPPPAPTVARRRRRRRRLVAAALLVGALVAAVVVAAIALSGHGITPAGPLVVGSGATVVVSPATGSCNTTFSFIARGPLSGAGTLVYRWEQSDGEVTANTSLPITTDEGAFQLTEAWRLQGSQTVNGTMTLHILQPVDRRISQSFHYSCP